MNQRKKQSETLLESPSNQDILMKHNIPTMMTIREVAKTGLMSEYTLRALVKQGKVPYVKAGVKVLINFELFCEQLNNPQQLCC